MFVDDVHCARAEIVSRNLLENWRSFVAISTYVIVV